AAGPAVSLPPRWRAPRAARRPETRPAELSLFRRHGRSLAGGQTGRPHRELGSAGIAATDHRTAERGGSRRILGSDSLFQRGPQAAPAGEGRNGPLYGGSRARLRRRAQAKSGVEVGNIAGWTRTSRRAREEHKRILSARERRIGRQRRTRRKRIDHPAEHRSHPDHAHRQLAAAAQSARPAESKIYRAAI